MIKNIQLYAERHTGSKWLATMINDSFNIDNLFKMGWKHWFPDYEKINEINQDEYLFIVLSRNPYDWIISMNRTPHHAHESLKGNKIEEFIDKQWQCVWEKKDVTWLADDMEGKEMLHERKPDTNERFNNIMELRNYKNKYFLELKDNVKNVHYIRYEDLMDDPIKVIYNISNQYKLGMSSGNKDFKPYKKPVRGMSKEVINKINDNINWDYEKILGYEKKYKL